MTRAKRPRPKISRRLRALQNRETRWLEKRERAKRTGQQGDVERCTAPLLKVREQMAKLNREENPQ